MAISPQERDSRSPSPQKVRSRSKSRSRSRSRPRSKSLPRPISPSRSRGRSRSRSRGRSEIENPGNTLYVTGLSTRVTDKDLESHFSKEGKVTSCFLVMEPRTGVSRGFAFVTMDTLKDAERCIKYLNHSVLEGRYITVERSRRKRPRTPTPGHYLGLKSSRDNDREGRTSRGRHYDRDDYGHCRSPRRDYSPRDDRRSLRRDYAPRDDPRSPRKDYSPRDDRRSLRRDYAPRDDPRSPRRDYSPRDGRKSRRDRSYSPNGRGPEKMYQPRGSR